MVLRKIAWLVIFLSLVPGLNACGVDGAAQFAIRQTIQPWSTWNPDARLTETTGSAAIRVTANRPTAVARTSSPTATKKPSATNTPTPAQTTRDIKKGTPTAASLDCLKAGGNFETGSLETNLLRTTLKYRIYLPPCYDEMRKARYPVLYLFHGQSFKSDQWDRIGADETADRLIAAGDIPPLLIVMPYDELGGQPSETRFSEALVKELVPYIDKTYRTKPDRRYRAVGGLSRGGGWAIHFALSDWDQFGVMGAHSPAVFYSDAEQMRSMLDALPSESIPRMYIDIGERDRPEILRAAIWFEGLLNEKGLPHEWHLFSGYHNEAYWSEHMEQYLRWYTKGW